MVHPNNTHMTCWTDKVDSTLFTGDLIFPFKLIVLSSLSNPIGIINLSILLCTDDLIGAFDSILLLYPSNIIEQTEFIVQPYLRVIIDS